MGNDVSRVVTAVATGGTSELVRAALPEPARQEMDKVVNTAVKAAAVVVAAPAALALAVPVATVVAAGEILKVGPRPVKQLLQDVINRSIPPLPGDFVPDSTPLTDFEQYLRDSSITNPSYISLQLKLPLQLLTDEMQKKVPTTDEVVKYNLNLDGGADANNGLSIGYYVERDAITLTGEPGTGIVAAQTNLRYRFGARARPPTDSPIRPLIAGSAGEGDEGLRRVSVKLRVKMALTTDWGLHVQTRVEFPSKDPALVTFLDLDVSDFMCATGSIYVKNNLEKEIQNRINEHLKSAEVQDVFRAVSEWQKLDSNHYLNIQPKVAFYTSLSTTTNAITIDLRLLCQPFVVLSTNPPAQVSYTHRIPLRRVAEGKIDDGFQLQTKLNVEVNTAARIARQIFLNEDSPASGQIIQGPSGMGLRLINIDVQCKTDTQSAAGILVVLMKVNQLGENNFIDLRLSGTPVLSADSRSVHFPNLEFQAETNNILIDVGLRLTATIIRDRLRQSLILELNQHIDQLKQLIKETCTHRKLNPHVSMTVEVRDIKPVSVSVIVAANSIEVNVEITGKIGLELLP